ncbi:hypothetical protein JTE90_003906 [Oedothorax gibbosus]|uniref:Uncharacterized protein n=1 Tax=Oedothorax gibbosus TaxID=931172 RepID=A0AAV6TLR7_9ARAC|nr:hypothetical protein JTE90_003906 [Oedothorax gibbosus]
MFKGYHDITEDLVKDFKHYAISFMKRIQSDKPEYGYLYNIIDERNCLNHAVYLKWDEFPLLRDQVLHEIEQISKLFADPPTEYSDATMLYLLTFYALLVNSEHSNWMIIEYLKNCNKDHQYAIHIDWNNN